MGLYEALWDDTLWFPENSSGTPYGWKDLENQPGSDTYYPQLVHLNLSILIGAFFVGIRFIFERFVAVPFGFAIGVSKRRPPGPPHDQVLENAFKTCKKIDNGFIKRLSKQTDKSVHQIQIWLRKRRNYDAQPTIKKFAECCWHFLFYTSACIGGGIVLWDKPWLLATKHCWIGWPLQHLTSEIYWYYILEAAFYWGLLITLLTDAKRKDFIQMTVHHVATLVLIYFSWMMNLVRIGTLVLFVHDASDPFLTAGKMCNYSKHKLLKEILFICFIATWMITRLGVYPFSILWSTTFEPYQYIMEQTFFTHWFFLFFLYTLMVLHLMWTYSIFMVAVNKLKKGDVEDVRSDSDTDSERD
ncbi:ceramide synthase 5-like [Dreissena polymorpha]|uniref:TLC domain-containing protein n=1 Tax=Dreissena polymorpha TaxID=45954 RepID=A0A9D4ENV8_DREPO|nr:ceramide synthase 5-like [Dreissena polymorpha]KAH3783053.1 hypothetical protein DPMN_160981 [Dreissena polymorpha]